MREITLKGTYGTDKETQTVNETYDDCKSIMFVAVRSNGNLMFDTKATIKDMSMMTAGAIDSIIDGIEDSSSSDPDILKKTFLSTVLFAIVKRVGMDSVNELLELVKRYGDNK